jgi:hypothetical protein
VGSTVYAQYASVHHVGWVSDVEIKRPGSAAWAWLGFGLKGTMLSFQPARTGTYYLRARLRHLPDNKVSGFCPYSTVKVS